MELEIIEDKENRLLNRREIHFRIIHANETTPKRDEVITHLVQSTGTSREKIVVDHIKPEYGIPHCKGYAKVYKTKEDALHIERKPILKRNKLNVGDTKGKKKEKGKKTENK